jgi:hypothetical protein
MNVVISDETERRFRDVIARHLGLKKGNISKALEEAIDLWIKSMEGPDIIYDRTRRGIR